MYIYVIDGSNRVRNRVNDRVFLFLPRSKPDRGTENRQPAPRSGRKNIIKKPARFQNSAPI